MRYCIVNRNDDKSKEVSAWLKPKINHIYDEEAPELVIAIGGDGTIIKSAHQYPNSTIFGVHTGHLGFYANYSLEELDTLIEDVNTGSYKIDFMDLLSCEIVDSQNKRVEANALNEITILTPPRTLILDVYIDNEYFEKFRGTGMCISTPSGSTAYNKSLHGSVIDSSLKCMQLTEIAGINSNAYRTLSSPLVLSHKRRITLNAMLPQDVFITVDHISYTIQDFKSLHVFYNNHNFKMAYHSQENFLKRIHRTFLISKK